MKRMNRWNTFGAALGVALAAALASGGCGDDDPIDQLNEVADCSEICSRYGDCIGEIDQTACTDACEDRIDANSSVAAQASRCEDCLDDRSCEEVATAGCFDQCPVVPRQD